MQHKTIKELTDNLSKQKQLYTDLFELTKKESEILVEGDIDALSNVLAVIEAIIKTLGEVEADRQGIVSEFAESAGLGSQIRLQDIVDSDSVQADDLMAMQKELIEIMEKISIVETKNTKLIKKALTGIDYMKNLFGEEKPATYTKEGNRDGNNNFLLDKKM